MDDRYFRRWGSISLEHGRCPRWFLQLPSNFSDFILHYHLQYKFWEFDLAIKKKLRFYWRISFVFPCALQLGIHRFRSCFQGNFAGICLSWVKKNSAGGILIMRTCCRIFLKKYMFFFCCCVGPWTSRIKQNELTSYDYASCLTFLKCITPRKTVANVSADPRLFWMGESVWFPVLGLRD